MPSQFMASRTCARALRAGVLVFSVLGLSAAAQTGVEAPASVATGEVKTTERSASEWLLRMHEASRQRNYMGTFVVQAGAHLSSARIWHACDGVQQMERVESLSGTPRSTFRRNDEVTTFLPASRVAILEKRESLGLFPHVLQAANSSIDKLYRAQTSGHERVAGLEADVVRLRPQDNLRFGYRIWSERKTGLVVKLQTLDTDGRVLEQAAFSELQLDAPVSMANLNYLMGKTEGYRIEKPGLVKTTSTEEGWALKKEVPGFKSINCFKRARAGASVSAQDATFQWVFSDGLASVSLFVDTYDVNRHATPGHRAMGATHTLTQRMGNWWLTAVGEVPLLTLSAFALTLERKD